VVTKTDYNQIAVKAAYSVLIEIVRVLGEYRDYIVLIGGWVPQFLFQNRLDDLVAEFRPHLKNGLIQEGLAKLAKNFASAEHTGPKFVTAFEEITDEEDRIQMERDAFERVNYLLQELGIV
jgi:hypothetical protein